MQHTASHVTDVIFNSDLSHAIKNYTFSVCVNNLVVNTSIDKTFPMKQILEKIHTLTLRNTRFVRTIWRVIKV